MGSIIQRFAVTSDGSSYINNVNFTEFVLALLPLDQPLDLQLLCGLQGGGQLVLGHVHLPCVHELQDVRQGKERDIIEDDDRMLRWVLLQQVLEIWTAGTQDHLVI